MNWRVDSKAWAALATLTALKIVLGIDNIIVFLFLRANFPSINKNALVSSASHGHGNTIAHPLFSLVPDAFDGIIIDFL